MKPSNCFAILAVLFIFPLCILAQGTGLYAFTHFKTKDGLASNIINNVVQDYKGFIWVATINGLQRYDGNKFITFKSDSNNPASLPNDEIAYIYEDRYTNFWVLTGDNKIGIFNTSNFKYKEVPIRLPGNPNMYQIKTLMETDEGKILLFLNKSDKLFLYNPLQRMFEPTGLIPFPKGRTINYILQDGVTKKYYMASDSGFVVYNPKTGILSYSGNNKENDALINQFPHERYINYLYIDSKRRLYFEQWTKSAVHPNLGIFNLKTGQKEQYNFTKAYNLGYHQIHGVLEQRNGKIWLYGLPFLAQYTGGTNAFQFIKKDYNTENDIKFTKVFFMYEDNQGNIWACTDNGIFLFDPDARLFENYSLTVPERFSVEGRSQTAFQMENSDVWMGYRDLGLHCFTKDFKPLPTPASIIPYQKMKSVWDIHRHSKTGLIWLAMQGGKIIVYNPVNKNAREYTPPAFVQRAITQIAEDKAGNLWLGNQSGNIVKWDYKAGADDLEKGFIPITKAGRIDKIFTDQKGFIWVAAYGEGVLKINPETNKVIATFSRNSVNGSKLWSNAATDIVQYNDSTLVVASGALNIININTNKVRHISTQNGLPSNTVLSLIKENGALWLGTLNGLCRADIEKQTFALYNHNDGILNDDFNVGGAHALQDGRLLFTTEESFIVFNPDKIRQAETADKAYLTDFKLSNTSLNVDSLLKMGRATLKYNQNSIAFEFSALNYCKLNKLDYYYILEGFDKDWIKSDDRHFAAYNYLPPGPYTFHVKTKNLNGAFSKDITTLNLQVNPPFWNTWWFYSLIGLSIAVVLYFIDQQRIKRIVALQHVRTDIASQLHEDVNTTLNNINVLSQIAKLKADRDLLRSKEIIDQIGEKSSHMVNAMDDMLWSIDPGNDSMEKTLLRISEHAKTLESTYGNIIDIEMDEKVKALRLDMMARYEFLLVCKETLDCLAQFANNKSLLVEISHIRSKIILKVLSNKPAMNGEYESVMQLKKRITERARVIDASLEFDITPKETSIVFAVPSKSHFLS